jgi:hypothetical protein
MRYSPHPPLNQFIWIFAAPSTLASLLVSAKWTILPTIPAASIPTGIVLRNPREKRFLETGIADDIWYRL